jgi:amidase
MRNGLTRRDALLGAAAAAAPGASLAATVAAGAGRLDFASAGEAAQAIRSGRTSSHELTGRMLERIRAFNPKLNAIVNLLSEQALAEAARADTERRQGRAGGPLHGVPIVVKDAFEIAGVPTDAGVKQLAGYRPARDSEVVRRLRAAGAVVLGNTNVPFFLDDWQSYNDIYGATSNPWNAALTPGGSSGGSAAALAAGMAYFSPGSDRAGSLRLPASFCGVYAHKPSLGVVPLRGWMPSPGGAPMLPDPVSVAGPMARSAADLRLGMQVLGGPDGDEARAFRWAMPAPRRARLADYRVGYVLDDPACPVDPPVREALERALAALGKAGVRLKQGWPAGVDPAAQHRAYLYQFFTLTGAPPGINPDQLKPLAARDDGSVGSIFAQSVVDPLGRHLDHDREQLRARAAWQGAFADIDLFLTPACFVAAFPHDHSEPMQARKLATRAGPRPYLDLTFWPSFAGLAGLPATIAPAGLSAEGLPVGLQIIGPYLEDATPIDFAERIADVVGAFIPPPGFA